MSDEPKEFWIDRRKSLEQGGWQAWDGVHVTDQHGFNHVVEIEALRKVEAENEILRNVLAVTRMANRNNPDIRVTHALARWDKRNG